IAERSAGNPFLVTELARQLAGRNAEPAAARAIVPDSVRALAGARVGELTGTARDVVLAASVLGTRFRRDVLASLAGLEPGELAGRNAEPAAARAIVPDSVRALAGARVGELTGTARDVVLAASVLGTRFRRDVLASLAGLEPGELAGALAAGRDTGLLQLAEP